MVGKEALMTDEVRQAAAEAEALQQDYNHLKASRKELKIAQQQRLDRVAAEEAALRTRRLKLKAGKNNLGSFRMREERAQRKAALDSGQIKVETLPIDKPLLRQISGSRDDDCVYFSATVPKGCPLLLHLVVKRG